MSNRFITLIDALAPVRAVEASLGLPVPKEPDIAKYFASADAREFLRGVIRMCKSGALRVY